MVIRKVVRIFSRALTVCGGKLSAIFSPYRKLRHSVVSRQERMRSILWNWPPGQFFFRRAASQADVLSRTRGETYQHGHAGTNLRNAGLWHYGCDFP